MDHLMGRYCPIRSATEAAVGSRGNIDNNAKADKYRPITGLPLRMHEYCSLSRISLVNKLSQLFFPCLLCLDVKVIDRAVSLSFLMVPRKFSRITILRSSVWSPKG